MKKALFISLIFLAACTTYIGVTKENYERNPQSYATLSMGWCSFCNLSIEQIDGRYVSGSSFVLSPGSHAITFKIIGTTSAQGIYMASLRYNFMTGRRYAAQGNYKYKTPRVFITLLY